ARRHRHGRPADDEHEPDLPRHGDDRPGRLSSRRGIRPGPAPGALVAPGHRDLRGMVMDGTLACVGLTKVWNEGTDREVAALSDIDVEVRAGEFLVVIGPSGCGKSTLLKLLAGLESPTTGALLHHGQPITGPHVDRSLIFQQPSLYPWLSARDNVAFGLKLQGVGRKERRRRADEFLRQVGLRDFASKLPHELSGGMQQRVAIARARTSSSGSGPRWRAPSRSRSSSRCSTRASSESCEPPDARGAGAPPSEVSI